MTQHPFILELMKLGVSVSLVLHSDEVFYDLNTGMKSHFHIHFYNDRNGSVKTITRYNGERMTNVYSIEDLIFMVRDCMCGRDFYNYEWDAVFKKYGFKHPVTGKECENG